MARCPSCGRRLRYLSVTSLFLFGKRPIWCRECSTFVKLNIKRLIPYYLLVNLVVVLIAIAAVYTGPFPKWLAVLTAWLVITGAIFPFVASFCIVPEGKTQK